MNLTDTVATATVPASEAVPTPAVSVLRSWWAKGIVDRVKHILRVRFGETKRSASNDVRLRDKSNYAPRGTTDLRPEPFPAITTCLINMGICANEEEAVTAVIAAIEGDTTGELVYTLPHRLTAEHHGARTVRTVGVAMPSLNPAGTVETVKPDLLAKLMATS